MFKRMLIAAGILFLLWGSAAAQRIAFIDSEKIRTTYKEWIRAQETFNTEYQAWETQAGQMNQELLDLVNEYEKQKLILSADKKAEREAQIQASEQALSSFTKDISSPGGRAEKRQMELLQPLLQKITAAIEKVALEEGYDFVFDATNLAYGKPELDITDKVMIALEEGE